MIRQVKLTLESVGVIAIASAFLAQTVYFHTRLKMPTQNISAQIERNLEVLEDIRDMHVETDGKLNSIASSLEVRLAPETYQRFNEKMRVKREQTGLETTIEASR